MKRLVLFILTFSWVFANAQLLNENFSYSTGQLTSNGGGSNVSGGNWTLIGGTVQLTVNSGSLSYTGYPSSGIDNRLVTYDTSASAEDAYRQFSTQNSGTVYASFLLNVDDTTRLLDNSTAGDYMVAFLPSGSTTNYGARLTFRKAPSGNSYNMGIRTTSTGSTVVNWSSATYSAGTTYLVVIAYTFASGTANDSAFLWVNPSLAGSTAPTPDAVCPQAGASTDLTDIARIAVRQSGGTPGSSIDGIRVGTNWTDITGGGLQAVSNASVTPLSFTSAKIKWTKPNNYSNANNTVLVYLKDTSAITAGSPSGTLGSITADSSFIGSGSPYVNDPEAKCVYKGDGDSITVTGLLAGTAYHALLFVVADATNTFSSGVAANNTQARTQVFFTSKFGSNIEGAVVNNISVSISNPGALATDTTFLDLVLSGGDAINGVDLASTFNTVRIKFPGNSTTAQVQSFSITNDNQDEWDETLQFSLRNISGGAAAIITADSLFNYTIIDNDGIRNPASGDIAFTQIQTDDNGASFQYDNFEFITLKRLDLRNLGLTDKGILADNTFTTAENVYNLPSIPALADVPAGTLVRLQGTTGTNDTIANDGVLLFYSSSFGLSTSGDQLIAFTGFNNFVAGINVANSGWVPAGASNTNTSKAPGTLADFHAGDRDNAKFRGPVTGTASVIRDSILSFANWDTSDTRFTFDFYKPGVLFNEPANQPTQLTFSNVGLSSMSISWKAAASTPQRYIVLVDSVNSFSNPADSFTTYAVTSNFGQSDTVVTSASFKTRGTGRVVYLGSDTSFTVSGLNSNKRYYTRVYALNGNGWTANYNGSSPLSGDTLTQNPISPVVKFAPISTFATEDTLTVKATISIASPNNAATSVSVEVKGGTATATSDYTYSTQTITFPANSSTPQDVSISIVNDLNVEGPEQLQLVLRNATNGAIIDADSIFTLTIADNDTAPEVSFSNLGKTVTEDSATVSFNVGLLYPNINPTSVDVLVKVGTATSGTDYTYNTQTITFPANSKGPLAVSVNISNDALIEGNETIVFALRNVNNGGIIGKDSIYTLTIVDNDFTKIGFVNTRENIAEQTDTLRALVKLKDYGTGSYSVTVSALAGTAVATQDYTLITTSLNFVNATDTVKEVLVRILRTNPFESTENFIIRLSAPTNGAQLSNANDTIDISNWTYPVRNIGQVNTVDANGAADSLGRLYELRGVVYGINNRAVGIQFTLRDNTGGIGVFSSPKTFGYTVTQGDSISIFGRLGQFNGLVQLDNLDSLIVHSSGNAIKQPRLVSQLDESTESDLVYFASLTLADTSQWPRVPFTGSGRNLTAYVNGNTNDSIQIRILGTCPLNGSPTPLRPFAMVGIGGQFDNASPFNTGYQFLPQFLIDLIPGDTLSFGTPLLSTVAENAGTVNVTVKMKNPNRLATSVNVVVSGGNATPGSDFTYSTQTVTFPATLNNDQTVSLSITDDALFESNDTILLSFQSATNNAFIDPAANAYTIVITSNDPNSVPETNKLINFSVYPNPARDVLNIRADEVIESIAVYDLLGKEVLAQNNVMEKKSSVDSSSLQAGIYLVKVSTSSGSSLKKVVIR